MSSRLPSLLKSSVGLAALSCLLSVGGCNRADKGEAAQGALKSQAVAALDLDRADAEVFAKHFTLATCEADEREALGALAGLGLGETGDAGVTFASRETSPASVSYRDLIVRQDGDPSDSFSADLATFHCARMGEDGATFDRLDLENALIRDEDVTFTFDTLTVSRPSPAAAIALVDGIVSSRRQGNDEGIGFGAVSFTDATVSGEGFTGRLDALAWGEARETESDGLADLMVESLAMSFDGQDGADGLKLNFAGLDARNMAVGGLDASQASASGMIGSVLDGFTLLKKPYDSFNVGKLTVASPDFDVDFQGLEGQATARGDVVTVTQTLKPVTVNLKPGMGENPATTELYGRMKTLGFDTIKLTGSSVTTLDKSDDSLTVRDGLLVMDDAFRLNFEYSAEGLDEMVAQAQLQEAEAREADTAPQNPMALYDSLRLRSLRLTLEDNSIVERGLRLATEMTGQSEKNLKRALALSVVGAAMAAENEVQSEVYAETASAFADFVKKGGTLTIEANPPAPFALTPLLSGGGADVDPDTLGFSASQAPTE